MWSHVINILTGSAVVEDFVNEVVDEDTEIDQDNQRAIIAIG